MNQWRQREISNFHVVLKIMFLAKESGDYEDGPVGKGCQTVVEKYSKASLHLK